MASHFRLARRGRSFFHNTLSLCEFVESLIALAFVLGKLITRHEERAI